MSCRRSRPSARGVRRRADGELDAAELAERSRSRARSSRRPVAAQPRQLRRRLLRRVRGGTTETWVRVDKELYGDVFRRSPKLTPLEARAIRFAIEYVGPTIRPTLTPSSAGAEAGGDVGRFDLAATPRTTRRDGRGGPREELADGAERRRVVEIEYLKEGEESRRCGASSRTRSSASCRYWRVHTGIAPSTRPRTFRLDRMRSARLTDESVRTP